MTDPMLEQQLSASTDTLSGIRIEESLNSQFHSPDQRVTDRKVGKVGLVNLKISIVEVRLRLMTMLLACLSWTL